MTVEERLNVTVEERLNVSCRRLCKRFADVIVVDHVDLDIRSGEFFSLLGPSGCGKTTTLRMLAGLEQPSSGTIRLGGQDITHVPAHRRATNLVFQQGALFPHLTVAENVEFGLRAERLSQAETRKRANAMLDLVGLAHLRDRRPAQLSGGQAQRIAIARALVKRPPVLLLDEPLSALDLKLQVHMRRELKNLQRELGTTFVCVTHNQTEALEMSDRLAVMNGGRIEQVGTGPEIYLRPATRFVASFIGEANFIDGRVRPGTGDQVVLDAGGFTVETGRGDVPVRPGDQAAVMVRPESIELHTGEPAGPAAPNQALGTVTDLLYLGNTTRYLVELAGGIGVTVDTRPTLHPIQAGTPVTASWPADAAVLLPAEQESSDGH